MKHRIIISILWIVVVGWCLGALPQSLVVDPPQPTVKITQNFSMDGVEQKFITHDVEDWNQFMLVLKLNQLSVEIARDKKQGLRPTAKIQQFKKLAQKLKE